MNNQIEHPKKTIASGALIFDENDRFLVVKPSYKSYWHIPGGIVEKNESPLEACEREVFEETNLMLKPSEVAAIVYRCMPDEEIDSLVFIFHCGKIGPDLKTVIKIPFGEIEDYKFIEKRDASNYLDNIMSSALQECFSDDHNRSTIYLENTKRFLNNK